MTDNSLFIPNSHAVSSDCLYNLKPSSVNGRNYRVSIPPTNGSSFVGGQNVVMYIPARRNCFLDPQNTYLKMTVQNNDISGNIYLDSSIACFINRMDIFSGSNLLETVQNYNVLYNMILDLQVNQACRISASAMYATGSAYTNALTVRSGATINVSGCKLTGCAPLLSGVVGLCAEKYLPLNLSDDIRLEFQLEADNTAVCYSTTAISGGGWKIINMELICSIVELSDEGMAMVNSVTPFNQPIYLHASTYRHYVSTLPAQGSSGSYTTLVPARFASLKSLWCLPRSAATSAVVNCYSLSSRSNPNISSYWWRIGSMIIPNKPVTLINSSSCGGYAEAYAEVVKAIHGLNYANYTSSICMQSYQVAETADTTIGDAGTNSGVIAPQATTSSYKNAFLIGQELETFAQRGDVILSGVNTLGQQIFFECNIGAATTNAYTLNFFAYADIILVLENGLYSVRY